MPVNAPLMSQEGNMFFPGTQCLKVSIPAHQDKKVLAFTRYCPEWLGLRYACCDIFLQVRQLMLGFSSEGISGGQDLSAWRQSFTAAFANPEDVIPVNWGGSDHFGGERFETNSELTNVSASAH